MALVLPVNAVVDIFRGFNASSPYPGLMAQPAAKGVGGHLKHHVRHGRFGSAATLKWTALLYLPSGTDIRSAYNSQLNGWQPATADTVVLADYPSAGWCTAFLVVLVQRINRGTPAECLRVHLDRLRPRQGKCQLGCCPEPLPTTIHATVPSPSGCFCLDGEVLELNYQSATDSWTGSKVVCSNEVLSLVFKCGTTSCSDATLTADFENHGAVGPITVDVGCSCSPFSMNFSTVSFPIQGTECNGAVSIHLTV